MIRILEEIIKQEKRAWIAAPGERYVQEALENIQQKLDRAMFLSYETGDDFDKIIQVLDGDN